MSAIVALGIILLSSIVIYFAGEKFAESSSNIGDFFNLPRDVKGATFDAVSSSLPELLVALYSVIVFKQFEVGIGTIAGSALFNLLVIPGVCVLAAPVAFKVSKKVISRDALFYLIAVFVLIVLLIYFKTWGLGVALLLLVLYFIYLKDIINHTRNHRKKYKNEKSEEINLKRDILIFFLLLIVIGVFTFLLTESAINFSHALGVSPIIIAFTIIAAATSVPDAVISITNARKGNIDDATSNVFGSNVFDIFVGIGFPLLIYALYKGSVLIDFTNLEIILGLLGATIMLLYFFADDQTLTKMHAWILLLIYLLFVIYTIFLAIF